MKKSLLTLFIIIVLLALVGCQNYDDYTHLGEKANLLDDYTILVDSIVEQETVQVMKNKNDLEMTELFSSGKHYLVVTVTIKKTANTEENSYTFDINDFKLKDHAGTALSVYALEIEPIIDYTWVDSSISSGEEKTIVLHFEVDKDTSPADSLFLEFDFSSMIGNSVTVYLHNR